MRKFRISTHGTIGAWYCIEVKEWLGWRKIAKYIDKAETAMYMIQVMKDSEK